REPHQESGMCVAHDQLARSRGGLHAENLAQAGHGLDSALFLEGLGSRHQRRGVLTRRLISIDPEGDRVAKAGRV
ncbi:MAG TPA: hypothetical protein VIG99_24590, partial [Myxococcaceae bacterium]